MPVLTQSPTMGDLLKYELSAAYNRETVTLKSGTSKLHGSFYYFNQNNMLNAMQFHQNLVPGATVSGMPPKA